jgi:hypothetical protein
VGISIRTLNDAAKALGVRRHKDGFWLAEKIGIAEIDRATVMSRQCWLPDADINIYRELLKHL